MKRHRDRKLWRRLWRAARLTAALAVALTVLVWFASRWCYATWEWTGGGGPTRVSVHGAVLHYYHESRARWIGGASALPGTFVVDSYRRNRAPWNWMFHREVVQDSYGYRSVEVVIPLWAVAAMFGVLAAVLRWDPRFLLGPGHCRKCAYDLTGLAAGAVCPECGGKG